MVRYIIDTSKTIEDLKGFNYDGYQFDATLFKGTIWYLPDSPFDNTYKNSDLDRSFLNYISKRYWIASAGLICFSL
jgi:hypothetical protein